MSEITKRKSKSKERRSRLQWAVGIEVWFSVHAVVNAKAAEKRFVNTGRTRDLVRAIETFNFEFASRYG